MQLLFEITMFLIFYVGAFKFLITCYSEKYIVSLHKKQQLTP